MGGYNWLVLPRDRFVSLSPQQELGQVTLKTVDIRGYRALTLNANAQQGAVWVEVLDGEG